MHPSTFILEEMAERGWDAGDLALAMAAAGSDESASLWELAFQMYAEVGPTDPSCRLGEEMAGLLDKTFGLSCGFWQRMENTWLEHAPGPHVTPS